MTILYTFAGGLTPELEGRLNAEHSLYEFGEVDIDRERELVSMPIYSQLLPQGGYRLVVNDKGFQLWDFDYMTQLCDIKIAPYYGSDHVNLWSNIIAAFIQRDTRWYEKVGEAQDGRLMSTTTIS